MKSIKVKVDKKGDIRLDFIGFNGKDCFEESDKLKKALAGFGLELREGRIIRTKGSQEVASELDSSSCKDSEGITI